MRCAQLLMSHAASSSNAAVDDFLGLSAKEPCGTVRDAFGVTRAVCTEKTDEMAAACKGCGKK